MNHEKPLTPQQVEYYFTALEAILFDTSGITTARALNIRLVLDEVFHDLCADTPQLFSDTYSRLLFIADKYQLPRYLLSELQQVRYRTSKRFLASESDIQEHHLQSMINPIVVCICTIQNVNPPKSLQQCLIDVQPLSTRVMLPLSAEHQEMLRLTVEAILSVPQSGQQSAFTRLLCSAADGASCIVDCYHLWQNLGILVWKYAILHVINAKRIQSLTHDDYGELPRYSTTADSLIILEPDYIVDVTDIAECFLYQSTNAKIHLLKKFGKSLPSLAMALGTTLNYCFDELIINPEADPDGLCNAALQEKPLSVVLLLQKDPEITTTLRSLLKEQCKNLKTILQTLTWSKYSIEPMFLSPAVGLQGRLDLMLEYDYDSRRKTVIELKSGKAPQTITTPAWENHCAQVTCYNILLDETFGEGSELRSGDSAILYSRLTEFPLRNIPNDRRLKQQVLALRNEIITLERHLTERNFTEMRSITPEHFGVIPPYLKETLTNFSQTMHSLSSLERNYFRLFVSFIARENWSARLGNGKDHGFAALWLTSTEEKERSYTILSHLSIQEDLCDFSQMYVYCQRTPQTPQLVNFRVGDPVVFYRPVAPAFARENRVSTTISTRTLKGTIKGINAEAVIVSLRNKFTSGMAELLDIGSETNEWAIEHDFLGNEFQMYYDSLYTFMAAPQRKKEVLLGLRAPEQTPLPDAPRYESLTEEQYRLLQRCLAAKDYFLLQGPPGTGKTSRMIYSIARYLYEETDENFLILAFTNRAVDEICAALLKIHINLPFIRLGGKDTSAFPEKSLYAQSAGKAHPEILALIQSTRIVVSTISSAHHTPEIFTLKTFATIIVDEASQVVEPQLIGLLTKAQRCILVGDEKQLPAVVTQPERGLKINKDNLNSIGVQDLTMSLFERLMGVCTRNGWDATHGVISLQGRMHNDLAGFPNKQFYGGVLQPLSDWQTTDIRPAHSLPLILQHAGFNAKNTPAGSVILPRLAFIPSRYESTIKIHHEEAERVAKLITAIQKISGELWTEKTLGVITPFRAQMTAIQQRLTNEQRAMVTVDTVERYQGGERDTIIISFAVSHSSLLSAIQSLSTDLMVDKKLNVALTRAQQRLIILGNEAVLSQSQHFQDFFQYLRKQAALHPDNFGNFQR